MKLLKNKKGSSVIEAVILTPITLYLILLAIFNVTNYINVSEVTESSSYYAREMIVCQTFEDALNSLSVAYMTSQQGMIEDGDEQGADIVSYIKIYTNITDSDKETETYVLEFDTDSNSSVGHFSSFITSDNTFDYNFFSTSYSTVTINNFESYWEKGVILEIGVQRDISSTAIDNFINFTVYDATTNEKITFNLGIPTIVNAISSGVIQN